jgi:hypothetical protein
LHSQDEFEWWFRMQRESKREREREGERERMRENEKSMIVI